MCIRVVSPTEYIDSYQQETDIVLVAVLGYVEIYEQLRKMNINKFGIIGGLVYKYQLDLSGDILNDFNIVYNFDLDFAKGYMKELETNVVDFCNLNCKGCSHFSNIFSHGDSVGYESFERDIRQLSQKIFIGHFDLLGGEAFLSEDLNNT